MSMIFIHPGGRLIRYVATCTVGAPDQNIAPTANQRWLLIAAGVLAAALDAGRTFVLNYFNGVTLYPFSSLAVASNVAGTFDISASNHLIFESDLYLRIDTDMAGTDADHIVWIVVLEIEV